MSAIETNDGILDRYPLKEGLIGGLSAFIAGFASIFALVQIDSDLGEAVENISANFEEFGAGTLDVVIWLFFNALSVNIEESTSVDGEQQFLDSYSILSVVETSVPNPIYTIIPLFMMVAGGYAIVYLAGATSEAEGVLYGGLSIAGYLPLTALALVLSRNSTESQQSAESVAVDPIAGVLVAGLALPAFFGALGGLAAFKQFGSQNLIPAQQNVPQHGHQPPQQTPEPRLQHQHPGQPDAAHQGHPSRQQPRQRQATRQHPPQQQPTQQQHQPRRRTQSQHPQSPSGGQTQRPEQSSQNQDANTVEHGQRESRERSPETHADDKN